MEFTSKQKENASFSMRHLSIKALEIYSSTIPLDIYEIEKEDGQVTYSLRGAIQVDNLSFDEVQSYFEEMYKEDYELEHEIEDEYEKPEIPKASSRLFVDMDGTLAEFKRVDTLETLYEEGYFLNLKPQENVIEAIRELCNDDRGIEVFILSSVLSDSPYALQEKNDWLDKHLPEIDASHRIFPPCGQDKKNFIPGNPGKKDFLLDDYTNNLTLWEPPCTGIKLLNGINHTHGTWKGRKVDYSLESSKLAKRIRKQMSDSHICRINTLQQQR